MFTFDVWDVDTDDKVSVRITNLDINGVIFVYDVQKGTKVLLGEGSEIKGPPYQFFYVPPSNYFTQASHSLQRFNITYTDGVSEVLSHHVEFPVLPVNDPPDIVCSPSQIMLPTNFIIGAMSNFTFYPQASDVDSSEFTFFLTSAPQRGVLKTSSGRRLSTGSAFDELQLIFDGEQSGGGFPYANFTVYAIDAENLTSQNCTYFLMFSCPLGTEELPFNHYLREY